jgi:hypothetical protein
MDILFRLDSRASKDGSEICGEEFSLRARANSARCKGFQFDTHDMTQAFSVLTRPDIVILENKKVHF